MNVFLTGHTSGIGLATYNYLLDKGYNVTGGSRSTGFDISDSNVYEDVLEYDVLINNAHHHTGQLNLLRYVYKYWAGKNKTIINVGSAHQDQLINRPHNVLEYSVAKQALSTYSLWIAGNDLHCRSMMYHPGHVDTPLVRSILDEWSKEYQAIAQARMMDPIECAKTIEFMISCKTTHKQVVQV